MFSGQSVLSANEPVNALMTVAGGKSIRNALGRVATISTGTLNLALMQKENIPQ